MALRIALAWLLLAAVAPGQDIDLFENKIRPVLATECYACHSDRIKAPMGGLRVDTRDGLAKVAGKPGDSRLLTALSYSDAHLKMPPRGKLAPNVIRDFETWVAAGAPDPRAASAALSPKRLSLAEGRKWWAFQPLQEHPGTAPSDHWIKRPIDRFVLTALRNAQLTPSPEADRRTLARRLWFDLLGFAPTPDEVESFTRDNAPDAYANLVDRLLASPQYGERWGRYWMDVVRWAEDNPTSEATNQPYPRAWRYRDWVIDALNKDIPYNRFVSLQLAADQMPDFDRRDLPALGLLGAAPVYHKDARLSKDVIEAIATDDWDERVDTVGRGILGLTIACARCHDHKFDPISTRDYYALAGVFASVMIVDRPMTPIDPDTERKFVTMTDRIIRVEYMARLMKNEPGTDKEGSARREAVLRDELARLKKEVPRIEGPTAHAVYDAGVWIDGSDPDLTQIDFRPGVPRDLRVLPGGNVTRPGELVPRRFLEVLSRRAPVSFRNGSGRLELSQSIFDDAAPLAARVIVNRVWGWHFGKPLVPTTSDFGTTGDAPTHPALLDDLAARFVNNGWSLKWLHREILNSAVYRQSSRPRFEGDKADPTNRLLWRMNPRRLDFETWRDSLLRASAKLDTKPGGESQVLDDKANFRRTVYSKISRGRLHPVFALYDFPLPTQHAPNREVTTTPLQILFVMNSDFFRERGADLAARVSADLPPAEQVSLLYRLAFARSPKPAEIDLGVSYLSLGRDRYAQALLASNEFQFWE